MRRGFQFSFSSRVKFRTEVVRVPFYIFDSTVPAPEGVLQLLHYFAHVYSVLGLQQTTLAGHLSAIQLCHRLPGAGELDTHHPLIRTALKGVARRCGRWWRWRGCRPLRSRWTP